MCLRCSEHSHNDLSPLLHKFPSLDNVYKVLYIYYFILFTYKFISSELWPPVKDFSSSLGLHSKAQV